MIHRQTDQVTIAAVKVVSRKEKFKVHLYYIEKSRKLI